MKMRRYRRRESALGCLPASIQSTRLLPLHGFASVIQDQPRHHSEAIASFFDDTGDPLDAIATEFNLNMVTDRDIRDARRELRRVTQRSLRERKLPKQLTVYRYGVLRRAAWKPNITSVTLDPGVAARGGVQTDPVFICEISRDRVLVDVPAVLRTDLLEEELLVRPSDLTCRETTRVKLQAANRAFCSDRQRQRK